MSFITSSSYRASLFAFLFYSLALSACSDQAVVEAATSNDVGNTSENVVQKESADREAIKTNCLTCGRVTSITAVTEEGESTGVGAAPGAIVGGIAGHQVGGGTGNKIATVAGAVGGAVAGNAIEKNRDSDVMYDVHIEMENGDERIIRVPDAGGISAGSDVTVEGNQIYSR